MALGGVGYWAANYWHLDYWHRDYWIEFGEGTVEAVLRRRFVSGRRRRRP